VAGKKGMKWKWSDRERKIKVPDGVVKYLMDRCKDGNEFGISILRLHRMIGSNARTSLATYLERGLNYYHKIEGKRWHVEKFGNLYIIGIEDEDATIEVRLQKIEKRLRMLAEEVDRLKEEMGCRGEEEI